jgi:tetratricopeptide (TPR) repeat protein
LAAGYYHLWVERDNAAALAEFEAASALLPSNAEVLEAEGELFRLRGDWQRSLDTFRAACALNPRDASPAIEVAETLWWLRRYPEAAAACDQAITLAPEQAWPHLAKVFNLWSWKGRASLAEARAAAELIPKAHEWWVWAWFWQEVYEGRYAQALALLDASPDDWIRLKLEAAPKEYFAAFVHGWLGDMGRAKEELETARRLLEAEVRAVPEDGRYHSSLGVVYAALGRREDAVREGSRGVELLPITKDAVYGQQHVFNLAHIHTLLGEDEKAVAQLEVLLSHPGWITVPWLHMDPRFPSLRDSPRFQALCAKYQVKE